MTRRVVGVEGRGQVSGGGVDRPAQESVLLDVQVQAVGQVDDGDLVVAEMVTDGRQRVPG